MAQLSFRWQLPRTYYVTDFPGMPACIVKVEWHLFASDGSLENNPRLADNPNLYGKLREVGFGGVLYLEPPTDSKSFLPFESVTEDVVIGWLEKLDAEEIAAKKVMMRLDLEALERDANPERYAMRRMFLAESPEAKAAELEAAKRSAALNKTTE